MYTLSYTSIFSTLVPLDEYRVAIDASYHIILSLCGCVEFVNLPHSVSFSNRDREIYSVDYRNIDLFIIVQMIFYALILCHSNSKLSILKFILLLILRQLLHMCIRIAKALK